MVARIARAALLSAVLWSAACECDIALDEFLYDDFQETCGDAPCGWESLGQGEAAPFAGIHASERGVLLTEGAIIARPLGPLVLDATVDVQNLRLLIGCDPDASVTIALTLRIDGVEAPFMIEGSGGSLDRPGLVATPFFDQNGDATTVEVIDIRLTRRGAGGCFIDELQFVGGFNHHCNG